MNEDGYGKTWAPETKQRAAVLSAPDVTVLPDHMHGHSRRDSTLYDYVRHTNHPPHPPNLPHCHPALPCPPWSLCFPFRKKPGCLGEGCQLVAGAENYLVTTTFFFSWKNLYHSPPPLSSVSSLMITENLI